ncbi:glycosyltransferase family 9 protein [Methylophilales bacterium]|nr:glycosyltransferase family 9 protein [Methylophilales bacterium]
MQQKKQNILIIKHGAFGDLIQSDGIFKSIKRRHPNAHIILLTSSLYKKLMMITPYFNNIIEDNRVSLWNLKIYYKLVKQLHSYNFSYVYDLQNSQRTLIYKFILLKNALWITTKRADHPVSGLQGLIDMLKNNGMKSKEIFDPDLSWMVNNVSLLLKKNNISKNYVVLIPGSSKKHKEKRWPFYKEIAKEFMIRGYDVINILGPDELDLKQSLIGHVFESLSWGNLAGVIYNSSFIIGNDSGPCHIASCLRKPGIALFGPTTSGQKSELTRPPFITLVSKDLKKLSYVDLLGEIKKSCGLFK